MLAPGRLPVIICGQLLLDKTAWLSNNPQASKCITQLQTSSLDKSLAHVSMSHTCVPKAPVTPVLEPGQPYWLASCAESRPDLAGTQIEEPFHVLPMDSYCIMMAASAKEQYQRSSSKLSVTQSDVLNSTCLEP